MKRVLIVEDDLAIQNGYKWKNMSEGNKLELIHAKTFADAESILKSEIIEKEVPTIDVISFDFNLDGNNNSVKLIDMINGRYNGIMIAASGNPQGRKTQMLLGCTHELESKADLINFILSKSNTDNKKSYAIA